MADVFISYASADRERIRRYVEAIEACDFSVWWDQRIDLGTTYDREIEQRLDEARCVVVFWTRKAVDSDWVRVEAQEGLNRHILVPALLDDVKPPLAFRLTQAVDLRGKSGLNKLLDGVARHMESPDVANLVRAQREPKASHVAASNRVDREQDDPFFKGDHPTWPHVSSAVAVLPFVHVGEGATQTKGDELSRTIVAQFTTPDVVRAINMSPMNRDRPGYSLGFRVAPYRTSLKYGDTNVTVGQIGAETDVSYVLEGTVRQDDSEIRIMVELSRVFDEATV